MKILICYFSGTGNTQKAAERFAEVFKTEYKDDVTLFRMENEFTFDVNDFDMLGIGYPVHAFNAPSIVLNFCKKLPQAKNKTKTFIFNTSGEPLKLNNISSLRTVKLLKARNFEVTNEYHYCMPYNMIFRHSDAMAYKMWSTAKLLIPLDVKEIKQNVEHRLDTVLMGSFIAWVMRCEHWGGRFNGKRYKVDENCIHCNKCVKICPTHNITIEDGKFKFGGNCLMCMRCAQLCGRNAIKTGWFNSWKVNGAYSFEKPTEEQKQIYNKMLTAAYEKYFEECDMRIATNYPSVIISSVDQAQYLAAATQISDENKPEELTFKI